MGAKGSKIILEDLPSVEGKVAIVTGGNIGIGFEVAKELAKKGALVIIASRNQEKVQAAAKTISQLKTVSGKDTRVDTAVVDLADMNSIANFGKAIKSKYEKIDILVNNAGVCLPPYSKTAQGFEVSLGVNSIGSAFLTNTFLPLLLKSDDGRIVFVSSEVLDYTSPSLFNKLINDVGGESVTYDNIYIYGMSKILMSFYAQILQRKLTEAGYDNVSSISLHPGKVKTDMVNKIDKTTFLVRLFCWIFPYMTTTTQIGALSTLFAAISPEAVKYKGKMLGPGPYIKLYPIATKAYNQTNAMKAFEALDRTIVSKGFPGFSLPKKG